MEPALGPFHGKQTADKRADKRFPTHQKNGIVPVCQREPRIFKPVKNFAPRGCACGRCGNDPQAYVIIKHISLTAAQYEIQSKCENVPQRFKNQVRMDLQWSEPEVNGKLHGMIK